MTDPHHNAPAWDQEFLALFERCCARYRADGSNHTTLFNEADRAFLASIGCREREFFDYVEDWADDAAPRPETALLIAAVRRDYFLHVQHGVNDPEIMPACDLPARDAEIDGIPWLPRVLQKAKNKLHGTNCPDIMYCCGGDRAFFRKFGVHPADFLRVVWSAGDDTARILRFLRDGPGAR